ncbi:alpha/beta hydrolase [Planococcus dechangensis]|uniref:Alpha/beta hydrolase n=1 Tax=Planococcus dechangensis TaxID=1176255 RepID=A0ABV9M9E7_9BACL
MESTKSFVRASDGHELFNWISLAEKPRAHVHIIHGMAEHSGRYDRFIRTLVKQGFTVSAHDQRGHGKTAERNGHTGFFAESDGFSRIVMDVEEVIEYSRQLAGDLPLIILGHSMGSFVARRYLQLYSDKVTCAVLSGTGGHPGISLAAGNLAARSISRLEGKKKSSPFLGKLIFGSYNKDFLTEKSKYSWLSRDAETVKSYEADPWCGFEMTNQFYVDLFEGIDLIHRQEQIARIRKNLPVLFISGSMDPVGAKGSGVFQAAAQFRDAGIQLVKVYIAEEARHEVLHELNAEIYQHAIIDWIDGHG